MRGLVIAALALAVSAPAARAATLTNAHFDGLTRIVATSDVPVDSVTITTPAGPATARAIHNDGNTVTVDLDAGVFGRTTSAATTIAAGGAAVPVSNPGEPIANAHILGSSQWVDSGWSTSYTDLSQPLYRFTDSTPNDPVPWNNGNVSVPDKRSRTMLVLFVQFPNRLAANSPDPYKTMQPYLDFVKPAADWWKTSSYGQFEMNFVAPQVTNNQGWLMMSKNANLYNWDGATHNMYAYAREAWQLAYDTYGIKADDYDETLIIPARGSSGLPNGPAHINRDPTDNVDPNTNQVAYVDHDGNPHYVSTGVLSGNDMYSWGYRWLNHEGGHTLGLPDLYIYSPTRVNNVNVNQFFYVGGWSVMGNISGHSNDYLGWHKYKLRWIRDDQVNVLSQPGTASFRLSPVETPGGSKLAVIRTGLTTAYVVEFRTKLGTNALDNRGRYQGMLLYRVDTSRFEQKDVNPSLQVISKQYYNDPAVGGSKNLTGVWRPITNSISGLDSQNALWAPGDTFSDPATGVTINFGAIDDYLASNPSASPYTANDTAALTVVKTLPGALSQPVALSDARLVELNKLTVKTSVELQRRILNANAIYGGADTYIREESRVRPQDIVVTKGDGTTVPVVSVDKVNPDSLEVTVQPLAGAADAAGLKVATKAFYYYAAGAAVPVVSYVGDVGATVPATLALTLGPAANFGALTPGVEKEYTASTTANVISTAGDAALSVSDPGHLTNGAFALPEAPRVEFSKAAWSAPVSNDPVTITFRQHVGATDALRTGAYSRTLTFTLSTTTP